MSAAVSTLRTGWEDATASDDTLTLAALRAMADRAVGWARAARRADPARSRPGSGRRGSPCLFLNVATATGALDVDAAARPSTFFPDGRPFALLCPLPTPDLRAAGLRLMGHPPFMVRPAGGAAPPMSPGSPCTR